MTQPSAPPPVVPARTGGAPIGKIVLFGCLAFVLLGIVVSVIGGAIWYLKRDAGTADVGGDTVLYRNGDHTFTGVRAENFVDFSFRYPATWIVQEDESSDTPNFVKVERTSEDNFTIENFAVGYLNGDMVPASLDAAITQLRPQLEQGFPNLEFEEIGGASLGGRNGRGVDFHGYFDTPEHGDLRYYGRLMLIPAGPRHGVAVFALATELADGVDGPEDVGTSGELEVIFDSFELGAAGPAPDAAIGDDAAGAGVGGQAVTSVAPAGGVYRGELDAADPVRDDGSLYDAYAIQGTAGERLVVTLESSDFDAYLTVISPMQSVTNDDDSGGGTDSRVELTLSESGTWTIMANAYRPGDDGAYVLTIER